jgi:hypothetical protein
MLVFIAYGLICIFLSLYPVTGSRVQGSGLIATLLIRLIGSMIYGNEKECIDSVWLGPHRKTKNQP